MALTLLCATMSALPGCADPDALFDEFLDRIPDAAVVPDAEILAAIPDISGRFLMGLSSSISPDDHLFFIVENTLTIGTDGALLDSAITPLDFTTMTTIGETRTSTDIEVNEAGQFTIELTDVSVPAEGNPVTGSVLFMTIVTFDATIRTEDFYCGDVGGMVTMPASISLEGSTFAAIRVPADAIGDELPPAEAACP